MLLISAIVTGLAVGAMYGLIALGFHITYVVSHTVNFSQGSAMMLGAVLGYTFAITLGWPMPPNVVSSEPSTLNRANAKSGPLPTPATTSLPSACSATLFAISVTVPAVTGVMTTPSPPNVVSSEPSGL